jgi:hypothetical protein
MACYGVPQSMLTKMEFGGPQDPTKGGTTKFTFDDRTAAIVLDENSSIKVPWHSVSSTLDYPNCIEFRIRPSASITFPATLISGSEFTLDLVQTTGSFYKLELNFGGNEPETTQKKKKKKKKNSSPSLDKPLAQGVYFFMITYTLPGSNDQQKQSGNITFY